jgi:hypothetical protein
VREVAASSHVPFAVQDAIVQVAGKAFWYKRPLLAALQRAGVPRPLLEAYASSSKYILMREVLEELDARGAAGARVQAQIVRELADLRSFGDEVDRGAATEAVAVLQQVAQDHGLLAPATNVVDAAVRDREARKRRDAHRTHLRAEKDKAATRQRLYRRFCDLVAKTDGPQQRGLSLEPLLGELLVLEGLKYHPPYWKGTVSQTDGFFTFESFHYLIEARWRKSPPDAAALTSFGGKVDRSLTSTRGLFLSIAGFREEAVTECAISHRNIILMAGEELAAILEGRVALDVLLRRKIEHAARTGDLYFNAVV